MDVDTSSMDVTSTPPGSTTTPTSASSVTSARLSTDSTSSSLSTSDICLLRFAEGHFGEWFRDVVCSKSETNAAWPATMWTIPVVGVWRDLSSCAYLRDMWAAVFRLSLLCSPMGVFDIRLLLERLLQVTDAKKDLKSIEDIMQRKRGTIRKDVKTARPAIDLLLDLRRIVTATFASAALSENPRWQCQQELLPKLRAYYLAAPHVSGATGSFRALFTWRTSLVASELISEGTVNVQRAVLSALVPWLVLKSPLQESFPSAFTVWVAQLSGEKAAEVLRRDIRYMREME